MERGRILLPRLHSEDIGAEQYCLETTLPSTQVLTLQVSDLVSWFRSNELIVNEEFQRRAVWTNAAKTYLVDTILGGYPIPKIYIRTKVDATTQRSIREIVDGQQRIRAIVEFANGDLRLSGRSAKYKGMCYADLPAEEQERFLGYIVTAEQLLNASDDVVLEVFARLNSYTVKLSDAEKRHAEFQTEFKWAVRKTASQWSSFLIETGILSLRQRVRMLDDELLAEMYRVLREGVCDGGAPKLRKFYEQMSDDEFTPKLASSLRKQIDDVLNHIDETARDAIREDLATSPILLMMFAAVAHHKFGIPRGDVSKLPPKLKLAKPTVVRARLGELLEAMQSPRPPAKYTDFVLTARKTSPQRISSRRIRFKVMLSVFGD